MGNNPVNYVDPTGHFPWLVATTLIGAAIGAGYGIYSSIRDTGSVNWGTVLDDTIIGATVGLCGGAFLAEAAVWGGVAMTYAGVGNGVALTSAGMAGLGLTVAAESDPNPQQPQWTRANRMQEFERLADEGVEVGGQRFQIRDHVLNSLRKGGRKDIMPDSLLRALTQERSQGKEAFTWVYVDPDTGMKWYMNEWDEIVGVQPVDFLD